MRTIWHSLAWKEWHEHKWKLASITAVFIGTTSVSMRIGETDAFGLAFGMLMLCSIPLAVFVGLGAAANERSRGTLAFLQSLPAPMWRVALLKLIFGITTLVIPIVITVASFYLWTRVFDVMGVDYRHVMRAPPTDFSTGNWYVDIILFCTPIAASLFIWAAAAGVNHRDEVRAGAVALAVMAGWYLLLLFAAYLLFFWTSSLPPDGRHAVWLWLIGLATAPSGFAPAAVVARNSLPQLLAVISVAAITHLAIAAWYVLRFGQSFNLEIRSPQVAVRAKGRGDWLAPPKPSPFWAITWKQFRESGPILLAGLAGMAGIVIVFFVDNPLLFISRPDRLAERTAGVIVSLGFGVALVVGIGVCLYDVGPQLSTFWRSRPINPDLWFWSKYLTGLVVLLAALYIPLVLIVSIAHPDPSHLLFHPPAMLMPIAHVAIFAAAVAMTCLVRHAVYAAILSIPTVYLGVVVVWLALKLGDATGLIESTPHNLSEVSDLQIAAGFTVCAVVCTLIAWLAMRYDWGRKSRY